MDRFSQVAAHLQSLRHNGMFCKQCATLSQATVLTTLATDPDPGGSSQNGMPTSSSPATDAADAEVRKHDSQVAVRSLKRKLPSTWGDGRTYEGQGNSDGNQNSESNTNVPTIKDEEMTDSDAPTSSADAAPASIKKEETSDTSSPAPPVPAFPRPQTTTTTTTLIYTISAPSPTLTLPPTYPFRTTPLGYPYFPPRPHPPRFTMTSQTGYPDPRITYFLEHWTATYEAMGDPDEGPEEGMFRLRLACHERGLVTYGGMEMLVIRLVERALRDAGRGWTEVRDGVGRVRVGEAPTWPGPGWRFASDVDYSSEKEESEKSEKSEKGEEGEESEESEGWVEGEEEDEDMRMVGVEEWLMAV